MKDTISEAIENLLQQFPYEALSKAEQELVLRELTLEEYQAYHTVALQTSALALSSNSIAPPSPDAIKKVLGDKIKKQTSALQKINAVRLPLWLATVLGLVGYGLVQFFQGNNYSAEPAITPEIVQVKLIDTIHIHTVDTIYQKIYSEPQVITKEVIKIKEVFIERATPVPPMAEKKPENIPADQVAYYSDAETPELLAQKPGRSVGADAELMELLDNE